MRQLSRYVLIFGVVVVMPLPAAGQAVAPREEGKLADLLPPREGERICYRRVYSAEHLAKHPDQTVTEVEFRLTYYRHEPDEFFPKGQRNYYFHMLAKRRGSDATLGALGECAPAGDGISCGVECDGGGIRVTHRPPNGLLISLGEFGRIRMSEGCDGGGGVLEPGKDDREFLLTKADAADCPTYEDW